MSELISWLGAAGLGLTWGWLMSMLAGRFRWRSVAVWMLPLSTAFLALGIWWLLEWETLILFIGAGILAFLFHRGWMSELRQRFGPV